MFKRLLQTLFKKKHPKDKKLASATPVLNTKDFTAFSQVSLFQGIQQNQVRQIYHAAQEVTLEQGDYLLREGDTANELFFLMEGALEVIKHDKESGSGHVIATLRKGEPVGEMAIFDNAPRSTSLQASTPCRLMKISYSELRKLSEAHRNEIILQMAKNLTQRLRDSNEITVQAIKKQLDEYKIRVKMGTFMINVIITLCLFTFALSGVDYLENIAPVSSFVSLPLTIVLLFGFLLLIKYTQLPLSTFGITLVNWRQAVFESVLYTIPILVLIVLIKIIMIKTVPSYQHHAIFEPFDNVIRSSAPQNSHYRYEIGLLTLIFYLFFISPIQELIVRGGLQSSLQLFLTGKNKTLTAILISNLILSTMHLYLSLRMALLVFLPGIFWGWLYSRHKTLIGVIISHIMMGAWAFWVVGI